MRAGLGRRWPGAKGWISLGFASAATHVRPMALSAPVQLDRAVFPVHGADAESFLQNLLTQDMARLAREPVIYTGLLTPQGKVAFDFLIWREGDGYLVDIDAWVAMRGNWPTSTSRLRNFGSPDVTAALG